MIFHILHTVISTGILYRWKYNKNPKATDLEEYFELKDIRLKDSSGKVVRGIELVRQK